jgi:hypothetical protein
MRIILDLHGLGPNTFHVESGIEDANDLMELFHSILLQLFPDCCAESAVIEAAMEILEGDEDD